ncbi:MAG TPA: hypothetical protein PK264_01320 [Hyphomicrobiaceae bacterium]|nr:hypothetical protein [Hyphomicrobiaceae bacterium]
MISAALTSPDTGLLRPVLHLSGPKLRGSLEGLIKAAEELGGIESFVAAVKLKSELFQERLGEGRAAAIERGAFDDLIRFMPTVRRRISALVATDAWSGTRAAMAELLQDAHQPGTGDARIAAFEGALRERATATDGAHARFHRDFAAELLHNVWPEHYPLMTRWVWDAKANTGVLREIWHDPIAGDATDQIVIDAPDTHDAFLVLREELSHFLSEQGIFRDMLWFVDLVEAHIYGGYINSQGGAWLKADFSAEGDPLEHTRRILGLDARRRPSAGG